MSGVTVPDTSCGLHHDGFTYDVSAPVAPFILFYGGVGAFGNGKPNITNVFAGSKIKSLQPVSVDVICFLTKAQLLQFNDLAPLLGGVPEFENLQQEGSIPEQCTVTATVLAVVDESDKSADAAQVGQSQKCAFKPKTLLGGDLGSEFGLSVTPTAPQVCNFPATWNGVTKIGFQLTSAPVNKVLPAGDGGPGFAIDNFSANGQLVSGRK